MKHKLIGLTGNTGAGKSTVAAALAQQGGAVLLDADAIARRLQQPGSETLEAIAQRFGTQMLQPDGSLNRTALGTLVFSDTAQKQALENLMWPRITHAIEQRLQEQQTQWMVLDAPLLFESGLDKICFQTWLVVAPEPVRRARIMARDGIDATQAQLRIDAQVKQESNIHKATHILDGTQPCTVLCAQALALFKQAKDLWG